MLRDLNRTTSLEVLAQSCELLLSLSDEEEGYHTLYAASQPLYQLTISPS